MSEAPSAKRVNNRLRVAALVIALTATAMLSILLTLGTRSQYPLIDTTGWRLGTINSTNVSASTNGFPEVRITRGYQVGPMRFTASWVKPEPMPSGKVAPR